MTEPLASTYDPKLYEAKLYDFWLEHRLFHAECDPARKPYTILMPPPNVTSYLHMGHGTGYTMQDMLVRWKRMLGFNALWLPGTDHAGIATQMMVEKSLASTGDSRQSLGRAAFTAKLWEWKDKYGGMILEQFRSMGFSCDWERLSFTLDPQLSLAVRRIFVDLFEAGLIYRGERLVNWDPVLKTALSDDELESREINSSLWHFKYPIEGTDAFITVATTRPETMFGDTAVAVHPDDERYQAFIGKQVRLPLVDRLIPIVADTYVKSEFGTGAVKITPAHDPNDFELGKRHNLASIDVMTDSGTMNDLVPTKFRGLNRFVARKEVVRAFRELSLLDKEEPYKTTVPISERSNEIIEPRLSKQWYVSMASLAAPAVAAANDGTLRFHPDLWKKTYLHWLENIQDWCISRQLWWGHRIPIWYCQQCSGHTTGMSDPTACKHCGSTEIRQDEDVLDTWFSSWLWPVSPFGWPDQSKDLDYFYPTDVLVTAPEIIFQWVARMVMVGLKLRGEVPFKDVFLTPTVCDKQGRKFSKTLGNGIDPLAVIAAHGTDAMRFTAVQLAPIGGRTRMAIEDFEAGGRFVNKLWNASRFLLGHVQADLPLVALDHAKLDLASKWLLTELSLATERIDKALSTYRLNEAADQIYHLIWGSFCDWGLETAKNTLTGSDAEAKRSVVSTLVYVLDAILRLASPIMPFVTEEIWQKLPHHPDWDRPVSLTIAAFPAPAMLVRFPHEAEQWRSVQDLVTAVRSARSQAGVPPKTLLHTSVRTTPELAELFRSVAADIQRLGVIDQFSAGPEVQRPGPCLVAIGRGYEAYIPADNLIDIGKERLRLSSEVGRITKIIKGLDAKLGSANFVDRAPPEVLAQTTLQRDNLNMQLLSLAANITALT